ncbi:MAG: AAA family ATPase [Parvibaculales bacterium]
MRSLPAQVIDEVAKIIRDKESQITLALAAFISGGHVLIEDAPGTGKTTLARALGHHLSLDWKRLQCTNDTMPSDILGVNIFDTQTDKFIFRQGPVFAQLFLADELNRAPSKSQSALLEAMAERQASIDGVAYELPKPFIMIATQNPGEQIGVSPLPESQLDRFAVSFSLGLPSADTEIDLLRELKTGDALALLSAPIITTEAFINIQRQAREVEASDTILTYLQTLATHIRQGLMPNLSVRALMQIKSLAQSMALIEGRTYVVPEDIQAVMVPALRHRLTTKSLEFETRLSELVTEIAVP